MDENHQDKVFILWDLIKPKLRPSELAEMQRLIGIELIDKAEDLRRELNNLIEINSDLRESRHKR